MTKICYDIVFIMFVRSQRSSHLLQNQGIEKGGLMLKSQDRKKAKYAIFFQHFVDTLYWYIKPIGK